ncbi:MAG: D-glycero-beta-D-manno-heptose 1,7-bisphosphate 7-phosphatase [Mariprofundaceae bacterium]|nr:D-glycero-beta-D-manno-heptose 1,7-bisphosphate 7-phosphatase [Mariprofundaceae bacterium]
MNDTSTISTILLDRDGVINFDSPDYILTASQWQAIPGSLKAIARAKQAGFQTALISNQSALGRGMISQTTFDAIHAAMMLAIHQQHGSLDVVMYCPHAPDAGCLCRKPLPGMIQQALEQLDATASTTVMIGDSLRDVQAAIAAGVRPILVQSGYGDAEAILTKARALDASIAVYPDLITAMNALLDSKG